LFLCSGKAAAELKPWTPVLVTLLPFGSARQLGVFPRLRQLLGLKRANRWLSARVEPDCLGPQPTRGQATRLCHDALIGDAAEATTDPPFPQSTAWIQLLVSPSARAPMSLPAGLLDTQLLGWLLTNDDPGPSRAVQRILTMASSACFVLTR